MLHICVFSPFIGTVKVECCSCGMRQSTVECNVTSDKRELFYLSENGISAATVRKNFRKLCYLKEKKNFNKSVLCEI